MASTPLPNKNTVNGRYLLCIEGLPFGYTWKDLKDLIRKKAIHGIWTEMSASPPPRDHNVGIARVQRADEAENLYLYLTLKTIDSQRLIVHLWDISDGDYARFMRCNCPRSLLHPSTMSMAGGCPSSWEHAPTAPSQFPAFDIWNYSMQQCMATLSTNQMLFTPQGYPFDWGFASYMTNTMLDSYVPVLDKRPQPQHNRGGPCVKTGQPKTHAFNACSGIFGARLNPDQNATRSCTISVVKINYKARREQVERLFRQAGPILELTLLKFPRSERFRGSAIIVYATAESAIVAVRSFHGMKFMDRELGVGLTHDSTATVPPPPPQSVQSSTDGPIIVDGSRAR